MPSAYCRCDPPPDRSGGCGQSAWHTATNCWRTERLRRSPRTSRPGWSRIIGSNHNQYFVRTVTAHWCNGPLQFSTTCPRAPTPTTNRSPRSFNNRLGSSIPRSRAPPQNAGRATDKFLQTPQRSATAPRSKNASRWLVLRTSTRPETSKCSGPLTYHSLTTAAGPCPFP